MRKFIKGYVTPQFGTTDSISNNTFFACFFYFSVNGVPACANKMLLTDVLRTQWNFTGFVISDAGMLYTPY